jgi:hypothetical protein
MMSEQHVPGTEFGELQLAMWRKQFAAVRDGDRFFYPNDPALKQIARTYGVPFGHTLAQVIKANTGTTVQADVFHAVAADAALPTAAAAPAPAKHVAAAAAPKMVVTRHRVSASKAGCPAGGTRATTTSLSAVDTDRRVYTSFHRRA